MNIGDFHDFIESEHFDEVINNMKDNYYKQWLSANTLEERETIYQHLIVLNDLVYNLKHNKIGK